jgi:hypothetical protein
MSVETDLTGILTRSIFTLVDIRVLLRLRAALELVTNILHAIRTVEKSQTSGHVPEDIFWKADSRSTMKMAATVAEHFNSNTSFLTHTAPLLPPFIYSQIFCSERRLAMESGARTQY